MIHRTMIVPESVVDLARALAVGVSGPAAEGMWTTPLSPTGDEPATHYISTGLIADEFAALMPLTVYTLDDEGHEVSNTTPGQPEVIAQLAEAPVEMIQGLLDACIVTDEEPFTTLARAKLNLVVPQEVAL